jgi:hypothetical protein
MNSGSKFFVKPLHDALISSDEITVSDSANVKDLHFNHHEAFLVLEVGEITLTDYLHDHHCYFSHGKI